MAVHEPQEAPVAALPSARTGSADRVKPSEMVMLRSAAVCWSRNDWSSTRARTTWAPLTVQVYWNLKARTPSAPPVFHTLKPLLNEPGSEVAARSPEVTVWYTGGAD